MSKHKFNFKKIITAKAHELINIQHNLGVLIIDRLDEFAQAQKTADDLPCRGKLQREARARACARIDQAEREFAERLGFQVLQTFKFVRAAEDRLSPGVRHMLMKGTKREIRRSTK